MTIEEIQQISLKLRGVTQDIKWGSELCFIVGGKIFLMTSPDRVPPSASFKVTPEDFQLLTERPGIRQAPYLARNMWVQVEDLNYLSKADWAHYIGFSYRLVAAKLPVKVKKEIGYKD